MEDFFGPNWKRDFGNAAWVVAITGFGLFVIFSFIAGIKLSATGSIW